MSIKALQDYTYYSKYARYNKEAGRRETWGEACERVKGMHLRKYPEAKEEIEWAFELVKQRRVLGSQRALQFGGVPCERKNSRIYNCTVSFCDRVRFFQECFWLLLCGCGTGFSVQKHHVAKLPEFHSFLVDNFSEEDPRRKHIYSIPDTIEGWADALGILLATYMPHPDFPEWEGRWVEFDYSLIRPEGSDLASGVGKAPGPAPLRRSLDIIRDLLDRCLNAGQSRLRPIDAYDLVMHASDAVLSGGVRRSATIAIFSPDDEEMATAKTGNWFVDNPQRARSNNSACLLRNNTTKEAFLKLMESIKDFGEPGFYWSDSTEQLPNPCVIGDSTVATDDGLRLVEELVGREFQALVDGKPYFSEGFWKTGNKEVVELTFSSGRVLQVTKNHKLMTTSGWKEADQIDLNEDVVIHNHREINQQIDNSTKDAAQGYLLGSWLGDGNISKNSAEVKWWGEDKNECRCDGFELLEQADFMSYNHKSESSSTAVYRTLQSVKLYRFAEDRDCLVGNDKRLTKKCLSGSWSYLANLLAGYFDADGTVAFNPNKGSSLRICSSQIDNLQNLQIGFNALGIYSKIYQDRREAGYRKLPDGKGGKKEFYCEASHELVISCDNIIRFLEIIPIRNQSKLDKVRRIAASYRRMPNRTHFVDSLANKKQIGNKDVFDCNVDEVHAFDNDSVYVHNCVEIGMWPVDETTGESGWQFCNLCEINGKKIKCKEDFALAARGAAIIGTLQAGYTSFDYLGEITERIVRREALLGVSVTGMMDNPDVLFDPEIQKEMAKKVLATNEWFAKKIGINPCARATCVKPAGTTSCLLGTASGIHPHHAKRYFRRTQANHMEPVLSYFKQFNPHAVEKSVWGANETDEVITFCIEVPPGAKTKNDLSAVQLLEHVKNTQMNWVMAGKRKSACTQEWLTHNVSNTINVRPDEWEAVGDYIYNNRKYFAGVSLLPASGDLDYPQAPMCNVLTPREIMQEYGNGSILASGLVVDGLHAFGRLWDACAAALGLTELPEPMEPNGDSTLEEHRQWQKDHEEWQLKSDWIRRVRQFAERYCDNDVRKCTYLMKHVNNWKLWLDLTREYQDVDYTQLLESEDNTKIQETIACAGGACQII